MTVVLYICHHCGAVLSERPMAAEHAAMTGHEPERVELTQRVRGKPPKAETQWSSAWETLADLTTVR